MEPTPSPAPAQSGIQPLRILKGLAQMAAGIVLLVVGIGIPFFSGHGNKVTFGPDEEVYYKDGATEADARTVGEALRSFGYFDGQGARSIQLIKSGDLLVVRFVVKDGGWNDASEVNGYQRICVFLAKGALQGRAMEARLCDDQVRDHKTLSPQTPPSEGMWVTLGKGLEVHYKDGATEADAQAFGKALLDGGHCAADAAASIQVSKTGGEWGLRFVLRDGAWDEEETVQIYREIGKTLSSGLCGNAVVHVRLCDGTWADRKTLRSDEE